MTGLGKFAAMANSRRRSREDQQRISAITLAASASGGFVLQLGHSRIFDQRLLSRKAAILQKDAMIGLWRLALEYAKVCRRLGGNLMIAEIVTFEIPAGMSRERVIDLFEASAEIWRDHPKLHQKNYLYDPDADIGGGVYTWDNVADAKQAHGEAFRNRVLETFGSEPKFQYFETPLIVQNRPSTEEFLAGVPY